MDGSPSSIIMFGLGNGTFNGSPSLLITRGLGVGDALNIIAGPYRIVASDYHTAGGFFADHHTPGAEATGTL